MELRLALPGLHRRTAWSTTKTATALRVGGQSLLESEDEIRRGCLAGFRSLLDSLPGPVQVVCEVWPSEREPGAGEPGWETRVLIVTHLQEAVADLQEQLRRCAVTSVPVVTVPPILEVERASWLRSDGGLHQSYWLAGLPGGLVSAGWLARLLFIDCALSLSYHIYPLATDTAVNYLNRQVRHMSAERIWHERRNDADPMIEEAIPTARRLLSGLTSSRQRIYQVSCYVTLHAPTAASLMTSAKRLRAAAAGCLASFEPCWFDQLPALHATLALGSDELRRVHLMDSSAVTSLYPWLHADLRHRRGLRLGRSQATGLPVCLDPGILSNANVSIFGHSGTGKSYLMGLMITQAVRLGIQCFVLDPEHEYLRLATDLGGTAVALSPGSGHSLNLFDAVTVGRDREAGLDELVELIGVLAGGLSAADKAAVGAACQQALKARADPVLADVVARISRRPGHELLVEALERWVHGGLGEMLSRRTNVNLNSNPVVFGLRELGHDLVPPIEFLLTTVMWRRATMGGRRWWLFVDELGSLSEHQQMRRFLVRMARRSRKYRGGLVFATQNPSDVLSGDDGRSLVNNAATALFGALQPLEARALAKAYAITEDQCRRIEAGNRGEFMASVEGKRLFLSVEGLADDAALLARSMGASRDIEPAVPTPG